MALQFEIDSLDDLDESLKGLYAEHNGKYRLSVEGIDPADELKEALRKEREEKAEEKLKRKEQEAAKDALERKALEEANNHKELSQRNDERAVKAEQELSALRSTISEGERKAAASDVVSKLTTDTAKARLLQREALEFIANTDDGIKINGVNGEAWDAQALESHLKESFSFLVDGSKARGGASQGSGSGGATKKFHEYTGAELSAIRRANPSEYDRIKSNN